MFGFTFLSSIIYNDNLWKDERENRSFILNHFFIKLILIKWKLKFNRMSITINLLDIII